MTKVLSGYATRAFRQTRRLSRMMQRYGLEREARQLLGILGRPAEGGVRIPQATGWTRFDAGKLDGMDAALDRLRELGEARAADEKVWINQKGMPRTLSTAEDLVAHPEILDVALHEDLLRAAADYLNQVPRLANLSLWWSPPNVTVQGSQMFHYDHRDSRQPKLFINLRESTPETGPLHFLGADQSQRFDRLIGYSQQRISDEDVFSLFKSEELHNTVGRAGEAFFVDTGRCLHYGSRGNSVGRLMLMVNYNRVNCVSPKTKVERSKIFDEIAYDRYSDDPVRRFVLTAPA